MERGETCQPYFFDSAARVDDNVRIFLDDPIESIDEQEFVFAEHNAVTSWPALKTYRKKFIDAIVQSLQKYFDDANLEHFEVLNPQSIKVDVENKQLTFPANDHVNHRRLASRLKINSPNLAVQIHNLYENVAVDVGHETFKQWTKLPAEIFFYKIETLSALLTLRINGPELKDFDCHKYLTDWKARGGLESDAQQPRGPGKKQDEDEIEEETDDPI
uniref:Uncharacterized protein n=1 Tax=Panagrolaimus davidi TaxID=227884 RepID=A0A914Q6A0_9BILA